MKTAMVVNKVALVAQLAILALFVEVKIEPEDGKC